MQRNIPKFSWPQMALVYLTIVSFGLAQPLYNQVLLFRREFQVDIINVLAIVAVFQFLVTLCLLAIRQLLTRIKFENLFDYIVFAGAILSTIRQLQLNFLQTIGWETSEKILLVAAMLITPIIVFFVFRRFILSVAYYAGFLCPLFAIMFVYNMATHPLPLNSDGEPHAATAKGPAVIFIVSDEFSRAVIEGANGNIDGEQFPNFKRLSETTISFPNAITNYPTSAHSFPSFLTGKLEFPSNPPITENIEKLPEGSLLFQFRDAGYSINIYTDYFGCAGALFHCENYLNGKNSGFLLKTFFKFLEEFGPDLLIDRFLPQLHGYRLHHEHAALLETVKTAGPGSFHMVHLMTSHAPYVLSANGGYQYATDLRMDLGVDLPAAHTNYMEQVKFLDQIVGRFLNSLAKREPDNPAIVMFMSDHGNCWNDDCPGRVHVRNIRTIRPELTGIPVFLNVPGGQPRVDRDDFQLLDVMPTLLDAAGLNLPTDIDGVSRLSSPPPPRERLFKLLPNGKTFVIPLPNTSVSVE